MTTPPRRFSPSETAALAKAALREAFPGQKMSVTSKRNAGNTYLTVSWVDGPTHDQVQEVAYYFGSAQMDKSDAKISIPVLHKGEQVLFVDWIFTDRAYTLEAYTACVQTVCDAHQIDIADVQITQDSEGSAPYCLNPSVGKVDVQEALYLLQGKTSFYTNPKPSKSKMVMAPVHAIKTVAGFNPCNKETFYHQGQTAYVARVSEISPDSNPIAYIFKYQDGTKAEVFATDSAVIAIFKQLNRNNRVVFANFSQRA